jgi:hypothetical protein
VPEAAACTTFVFAAVGGTGEAPTRPVTFVIREFYFCLTRAGPPDSLTLALKDLIDVFEVVVVLLDLCE